ncbi:MAG: hypothetical protein KAT58_09965 [candidate division Zixibacteria bacterium]|nr:hypothetical protein [candidate division Zixibacteria bacterium]
MFIGIFILALGVLFLLKSVSLIYGETWNLIWPLLIIAFGASLIFKRRHD